MEIFFFYIYILLNIKGRAAACVDKTNRHVYIEIIKSGIPQDLASNPSLISRGHTICQLSTRSLNKPQQQK